MNSVPWFEYHCILTFYYSSLQREAYKHLEQKYKGKLYITRSDAIYLDVMNINEALQKLMDRLHISSHEVLVMGNSFNDIAMFEVIFLKKSRSLRRTWRSA